MGAGDQWPRETGAVGITVLVRGGGRDDIVRGSGRGLAAAELGFVGELFAVGFEGGSDTEIMGALTLGFDISGSEIEKVGTLPFVFTGSEMDISGVWLLFSAGSEKEKVGILLLAFGGSSKEILGILLLVFKGAEGIDELPMGLAASESDGIGVFGRLILGTFTDAE